MGDDETKSEAATSGDHSPATSVSHSGTGDINSAAGDQNINYGHQEVGINKGVINREITPKAALYGVAENVPDGDAFLSTYRIVLTGRPAALRAVAPHENVTELDMHEDKDWSAGFALAYGENPEGFPLLETPNPPPGSYILEVRLRAPVTGLVPKLGLLRADPP